MQDLLPVNSAACWAI